MSESTRPPSEPEVSLVYSPYLEMEAKSQSQSEGAFEFKDAALSLMAAHFDREHYLAAYPEISAFGLDPFDHFVVLGWTQGKDPTLWFDTKYYLKANPDVEASGLNPFFHYL